MIIQAKIGRVFIKIGLDLLLGNYGIQFLSDKVLFVFLDPGTPLQVPKMGKGMIYSFAKRMVNMVSADKFPKNPCGLCDGWCPYVISCTFENVCLFEGM